jgi:hypothetical protein
MNAAENIIYAVFTSGAFFGEFALLFSQRRTATIKGLPDTPSNSSSF